MKTRFKNWKWRDMPWIIIGVTLMFILMMHVNTHIEWPANAWPAR